MDAIVSVAGELYRKEVIVISYSMLGRLVVVNFHVCLITILCYTVFKRWRA